MFFTIFERILERTNISCTLVAMLSFVWCYQHFSKKSSFKSITTKLPTKYGLPFIGIVYQFLPMRKFFYVLENNFKTLRNSTFCAWLGMDPFVITVDPDIVKVVLSSEEFLIKARSIYSSIDHALPNGIMTSNGSKWRHNRRLMNFSFGHQVLKNLVPILNKGAKKTVLKLDTLAKDKEHHIFGLIKRIVIQTAIETTMGFELKDGDEMHEKLSNGFNFMIQEVAREMVYNTVHLGFLVHTSKYYKTIQFLRKYVANLVHDAVGDKNDTVNELENKAEHEIFIKQAMSYQQRGLFTFDDVISETHTMIAGSFDTVSTTIFSIIVLLAMHADVQEKLFNEVCNILPTKDAHIDYEKISQAPYMDKVIDEALRLMPSIPVIARESSTDVRISDELVLPKGMQVMIPIFLLHRCKDIWGPNANDFDPENFDEEKVKKRHSYGYIPFSKGPRNCLGIRYARVAVRILLLTLVRNFKFTTSFKYADLVFLESVSLRYEQEPKIKIERRF